MANRFLQNKPLLVVKAAVVLVGLIISVIYLSGRDAIEAPVTDAVTEPAATPPPASDEMMMASQAENQPAAEEESDESGEMPAAEGPAVPVVPESAQPVVPAEPVEPIQPVAPIEPAQPTETPTEPDPLPPMEPAEPPGGKFLIFNGDEFNRLFNEADLPNLVLPSELPSITGDPATDQRIRRIAVERGYRPRPSPADTSLLVLAEGDRHYLQSEAAEAYEALRSAAAADGLTIWLVSAYRNHDTQRAGFLRQLPASRTDAEIFERLKLVAAPGYSKHHTGYTIDLGQGSEFIFERFADSASYAWLSANNFENAKRHGWIPSYPEDATNQGADPEAWEFTYVGRERLIDAES